MIKSFVPPTQPKDEEVSSEEIVKETEEVSKETAQEEEPVPEEAPITGGVIRGLFFKFSSIK